MNRRSNKTERRADPEIIYADAGDEGFRFIFPGPSKPQEPAFRRRPKNSSNSDHQAEPDKSERGGLQREQGQGHFVTIVGRGGTGKSFLALQLVTHLLRYEEERDSKDLSAESYSSARRAIKRKSDQNVQLARSKGDQQHAAFYFTLEASPRELASQAKQFTWGHARFDKDLPLTDSMDWECRGLHVISIPSPVTDLSALMLLLGQTIASRLASIGRLVAIVIDPLGGVLLSTAIRNEISQLRELASSHSCFLFLLTEEHIFERHRSIEHYSQTVIHLRHDHETQPYRSLHVQKSRGQPFRSGHHQLEFDKSLGLQIFPSMQAQSAYAHEMAALSAKEAIDDDGKGISETGEPFINIDGEALLEAEITRGSVLFLMGPPGTFKQLIATNFASLSGTDSSIYISFKAERGAVVHHARRWTLKGEVKSLEDLTINDGSSTTKDRSNAIYFLDARSPLLTPELVLSQVRVAISKTIFSRAVVWGLRRLNDMPNFSGGKAVQFLEALVTLLRSRGITSLLVDWPDKERASTLPIVDLSQYILLTRVCRNPDEIIEAYKGNDTAAVKKDVEEIWGAMADYHDHVTFLRVQRKRKGFYRDQGCVFQRHKDIPQKGEGKKEEKVSMKRSAYFERLWKRYGISWEEDPGLVN